MEEFRFTIEGSHTPATLPMERLATYLAALARLLGEPESVHLTALRPGSVALALTIDNTADARVGARVRQVRDSSAPPAAMQAFREIDSLLRQDFATGRLNGLEGAEIIHFPGRERPKPLVFGPFRQDGTIDGQLIRVGGKDETIPVHLLDGDAVHICQTTREVARSLAPHLFGPSLRVGGTGQWVRGEDGAWTLREFRIAGFDVLDETPLPDLVAALRHVKGSTWEAAGDPLGELLAERCEDGD